MAKASEEPLTSALGNYRSRETKKSAGIDLFTSSQLERVLGQNAMPEFLQLAFRLEQKANKRCPKTEVHDFANYKALFALKKGDFVVSDRDLGKGQVQSRFSYGKAYELLEDPQMYTGTGHVHLTIADDSGKIGVASCRVFGPRIADFSETPLTDVMKK